MSISNKIALALILLGAALPLPAQEKPERHYRVELIVLRHLAGHSDPTPQESLRDLTEALDLYSPQPAGTASTGGTGDNAAAVGESAGALPATIGTDGELIPQEPIAVRIDDMSDAMRETWRRLRGSAGFRPELFRAWEQSGDQPFPQLRIHDDEVLYEIDTSTLLGNATVDEHGALVFSDQTMNMAGNSGGNPESATSTGEESELPPIHYFYRIDGTASLVRSRYLHLELDIELREPLYESVSAEGTVPGNDSLQAEAQADVTIASDAIPQGSETLKRTGPAADAPAFRIHRIAQKRQVKAGQLEYFDGPVIGLLVLVTGFDVNNEVIEDVEPEPSL